MRTIDTALQAHLETGTTTLAWCWRITRSDGMVLGFTDHDRDLVFDGVTHEAESGFTATEARDSIGLSVDNLEVDGAVSSDRLDADDLARGRYDDATIEIFRLNWADVAQRALIRSGTLGEVRQAGIAFSAEVRGLTHRLQQPRGRLYQHTCDAAVGDARCGVDLTAPAYRGDGRIMAVQAPRRFLVSGLDAFAAEWFARGQLVFVGGGNDGVRLEIKTHGVGDLGVVIELWNEPPQAVAVDDAFAVTAGCDKHIATCRQKFANAVNFRGFPDMPGNDFVLSPAGA